jgi:GNAT superfamily N-acetyltransferase
MALSRHRFLEQFLEQFQAEWREACRDEPAAPPVPVAVRPLGAADRAWAGGVLTDSWGGTTIVSLGQAHDTTALPGLVAEFGGERLGLATYALDENGACELVTLDSLSPGRGVGGALLEAVVERAVGARCSRVWLITTNDNVRALRFYQRRGFDLVAVNRDAVTRARREKPQIPETGQEGIPLRHEVELERRLTGRTI